MHDHAFAVGPEKGAGCRFFGMGLHAPKNVCYLRGFMSCASAPTCEGFQRAKNLGFENCPWAALNGMAYGVALMNGIYLLF
jgi:hypothetical protein